MTRRPAAQERLRRVADVAGLVDLRADLQAVAELEEAVGENLRLAGPLGEVLDRLEQSLVPLLERLEQIDTGSQR